MGIASCAKKTGAASLDAGAAMLAAAPPQTQEHSLFERIASEEGNKDKADPPTSKVVEALKREGVTVTSQEPQLGAPIHALFCLRMNASPGLTISVCEYSDAASANAGAEISRVAFATIEGRTVDVNRATTLSVIDSQGSAASTEAKKRARAAFQSL